MSPKKMGRPTDNPKGIPVHVRLDAECNMVLEKYCKQESVTRVEAIRHGIKKLKGDLKKIKEAVPIPTRQSPLPQRTPAKRQEVRKYYTCVRSPLQADVQPLTKGDVLSC